MISAEIKEFTGRGYQVEVELFRQTIAAYANKGNTHLLCSNIMETLTEARR